MFLRSTRVFEATGVGPVRVAAHLRKNETFAQLGAGFGVSEATAWRCVDEALDVLASWAPGLHEALTGLCEGDVVIVDGTLIPTGEGMFARGTQAGVVAVAVVRGADGGAGALVGPIGQDENLPREAGLDDAVGAGGAPVESKSWRALHRARCSTRCISRTVRAEHTFLPCQYTG